MNNDEKTDSGLLCISPENGMQVVESAFSQVYEGLANIRSKTQKTCFKKLVGESGASGGMGLAAGLLSVLLPPVHDILLLTSARGGMNAATLVRLKKKEVI